MRIGVIWLVGLASSALLSAGCGEGEEALLPGPAAVPTLTQTPTASATLTPPALATVQSTPTPTGSSPIDLSSLGHGAVHADAHSWCLIDPSRRGHAGAHSNNRASGRDGARPNRTPSRHYTSANRHAVPQGGGSNDP